MRQLPLLTPPVLSVADLTRYLRQLFEGDDVLADVWVSGEISNLSRPASGHIYFTLKDAQAALRCVIWKSAALRLRQDLQNGQAIEAHGSIGIYEAGGNYQLYIDTLRPAGEGALYQEFLRLKDQLEAEGLFDLERKRPIPAAPQRIGLVTSPTGAALQDMLNTLRRRYPLAQVILAPCAVQGVEAPPEIVAALQRLAALPQPPDVILAARGGGSLEDLWAFNDETLARTVVQSPVPLICGVGHETDFSIADFCADLRAATPTAAAELVSAPRETWLAALHLLEQRLAEGVQRQLDQRHLRLDQAGVRLGRPSLLAQREQLALAGLAQRLRQALLLNSERQALVHKALEADFARKMKVALAAQRQRMETAALRLQLLDPALVLQRGYALLQTPAGELVRSVRQAPPATALRARLADGEIELTVVPPRLL